MRSPIRGGTIVLLLLLISASVAHADRRYFVQSYTPYLAPAENLELELTTAAASGQGDSSGTAWQNRIELEYGITDRLTGAAYLNFVQPAGEEAATIFDGPSLELIYRLAEPGSLPVDPAAYVEVRGNGGEWEIEPKLLLARRIHRLVGVANVIGEFERHTSGAEKGTTEKLLQFTAGASREIGPVFAFGLEFGYARSFVDEGPDPARIVFGPTINLQTPKIQLAAGWQPQVWGRPASHGRLDLADFPRSEFKLIVGVGL